jgi:hypothetical protein
MSEYPVEIKVDVAVVNQEVEWSVVNPEAEMATVLAVFYISRPYSLA